MTVEFSIRTNAGEVAHQLFTVIHGVDDLQPFFAGLRAPWYASRREMFSSLGESTESPWPRYDDTPESARYVYAKGSILGMPGPAGNDDILRWGGPARLYYASTGESSEAVFTARERGATVVVDVPYASHHDEGKGTAPEWAWPKGMPYTVPRRPLLSPAGQFVRDFSRGLGEHLAATGGRFGFRSAEAQDEIRRAFRSAAARSGVQQ